MHDRALADLATIPVSQNDPAWNGSKKGWVEG